MPLDLLREQFGEVLTYTPTWIGNTTNPAIGNGMLEGRYFKIGKLYVVSIALLCGSTTTYGSGTWRFSTPTTMARCLPGSAWLFDTGTADRMGIARLYSSEFVIVQAIANSASYPIVYTISSVLPFTWATGDRLDFSFMYY